MTYVARGHSRFNIPGLAILIPLTPQQEPRPVKGDLENMSFNGCSVLSQRSLKPGTAVDFDLAPDIVTGHICGKGVVKHVREVVRSNTTLFSLGIEFTSVSKEALVSLLNVHRASSNLIKREARKPKTRYEGPL